MGVCSVIGCKSRSKERRMPHRASEGVTFHAFPSKNLELRARWCMAIRGDGWVPSKYAKVCSKHFEERCFDRSGQTCRLRENAMPTLGVDPHRLTLALANTPGKLEFIEPAAIDPLSDPHGHSSAFVNVVAEAVLNAFEPASSSGASLPALAVSAGAAGAATGGGSTPWRRALTSARTTMRRCCRRTSATSSCIRSTWGMVGKSN